MFFILSASYVREDLRTEVGDLPLAFIPLANRRLYRYQVEAICKEHPNADIRLTLPADFAMSATEANWLSERHVKTEFLDPGLTLGQELSVLLKPVSGNSEPVTVVEGSSLPESIPAHSDWLGVYETDLEPPLPVETYGYESDLVWNGAFSVSRPDLLKECLVEEDNDYFRAIKLYSFRSPLTKTTMPRSDVLSNSACYLAARSAHTSERAFNSLVIDHVVLKKYSEKTKKIAAEATWFRDFPEELRHYLPQFLGERTKDGRFSYSLEYLAAIPLNETFVYGRQTVLFWDRVFLKISQYLRLARVAARGLDHNEGAGKVPLLARKAGGRIEEFVAQTGFDLDAPVLFNKRQLPCVRDMLAIVSGELDDIPELIGYVHGDLCFSNILYDTRMRSIKLIDPRGLDADEKKMLVGSQLYDYAKLGHSVLGLYDHIIAGQYDLKQSGASFVFEIHGIEEVSEIQEAFVRHISDDNDIDGAQIEKILPLLFFSMLPLHADDARRQMALLANAIRLFSKNH